MLIAAEITHSDRPAAKEQEVTERPGIPFPPYSAEALQRRFPNCLQFQHAVGLLRLLLVEQAPLGRLLEQTHLSRATLYRLVHAWEQHGLAGLWPVGRARQSILPKKRAAVCARVLLLVWREQTTFALGCIAEAQIMLPHIIDPAQRGGMVAATIQATLPAIDRAIELSHGPPHLLKRHIINRQPINLIADTSAWSRRQISRYLHTAYQQLAASLMAAPLAWAAPWHRHLPKHLIGREADAATLSRLLADNTMTGLSGWSGVGKSALVATLMTDWERAGWNVIWHEATSSAPDLAAWALSDIYQQLAALGGAPTPHLDATQPSAAQLTWLRAALDSMPIVLVIDNVHGGRDQDAWLKFLVHLSSEWRYSRVLLVGRVLTTLGATYQLNGLEAAAARAMYSTVWGDCPHQHWSVIYAQTRGNPGLLQLIDQGIGAEGSLPPMRLALSEVLGALSVADQHLLLWLSWWEGPIDQNHPFVEIGAAARPLEHLVRQQLVTLVQDRLVLHDLVREHLPKLVSNEERLAVERQVEAFAVVHGLWDMAYRCAASRQATQQQWEYCRQQAAQLEFDGEAGQALAWLRRIRDEATMMGDSWHSQEAALAEIDCLLRLNRATEASTALAALPQPSALAHSWRAALYEFEANRLAGYFAVANAALAAPILMQPVPLGITEIEHWRLRLGALILAWYQDSNPDIWHDMQALATPPAATPVALSARYYRAFAVIASSVGDYDRSIAASSKLVAMRRADGPAYSLAEAQIALAQTLYSAQQHMQAERLLTQILPAINSSWLWLQREASKYRSLNAFALGNFQLAAHLHAEVVRCNLTLGIADSDPWWMEGMLFYAGGDFAAAQSFFQTASANQELGSYDRLSLTLWQVLISLRAGDQLLARQGLTRIIQTIRDQRFHSLLFHIRIAWADVCAASGKLDRAVYHAACGARDFAARGLRVSQAEALGRLSEYLLALGRSVPAQEASRRAAAILVRQPTGLFPAPQIWLARARALEANGQSDAARQAWARACKAVSYQQAHLAISANQSSFVQQSHILEINARAVS